MSQFPEACRTEIIYRPVTMCYASTIRLILCITGAFLPHDPMIFLTNSFRSLCEIRAIAGYLHLQKIRRLKVPTNTAKIKEDMV